MGTLTPSPPTSGTTSQLARLCAGYFVSYVLTGVLVKYFTVLRQPKMGEFTYLFNNTAASALLCVAVVLALGWVARLALTSHRMLTWGRLRIPAEAAYIVPSGVCTAV